MLGSYGTSSFTSYNNSTYKEHKVHVDTTSGPFLSLCVKDVPILARLKNAILIKIPHYTNTYYSTDFNLLISQDTIYALTQ